MAGPWIGLNAARTQDGRPQFDGACAFLINNQIFSLAEERISRLKHDGSVWRVLLHGLDVYSLQAGQVERILISTCGEPVPTQPAPAFLRNDGRVTLRDFFEDGSIVHWVPSHHESHAWEAIFSARLVDVLTCPALIYIADRVGQPGEHQSVYLFDEKRLRLLARDSVLPNTLRGLGETYDRVTSHLGWKEYFDAGKTMALGGLLLERPKAPYQVFFAVENDQIRCVLSSDLEQLGETLGVYCVKDPLPERRLTDGARLAALLQAELESAVCAVLSSWVRCVDPNLIIFGGGLASNCKLLGSVAQRFPRLRVQGTLVPGDTGQGIGNLVSAFFGATGELPLVAGTDFRSPFWPTHAPSGKPPRDKEVPLSGGRCIHLVVYADTDVEPIANLLLAGDVIATCESDLEPGPRALGFHSLLADARDPAMPRLLNQVVKHRESFRPFGALITAQAAREYFGLASTSPFMDLALPTNDEFRRKYPAVVHSDGSVRIQSVSSLLEHSFAARLMEHLSKAHGIEAIVNTSLNLSGKPIILDVAEVAEFL